MESHYALSDSKFEEQFELCTLDPDLFTHEAHLRLAWVHITKYGLNKAIVNIVAQLVNYTIAIGERTIYNETVTIAAVKIVYHFMLKSQTDNFKDFIAENSRLKHNFKELIASHYRTDIFSSESAKSVYLEPELLPFD
jgi:hypothetical protein